MTDTSNSNGVASPPSDQLAAEAAAWFARMHSDQVTSADEMAFMEWLDAAPGHRGAYQEACAMWAELGALRAEPDMRAFLQHLSHKVAAPRERASSRRSFLLWTGGGAAAAAVALIGGRSALGSRTYSTAFGEQRRVALADGSTLTLNTETTVRVVLDASERRIWLNRGQAHFIVAPDLNRPFRVFAADEEVRALGTRFEVRRERSGVKVTLEEGSVAIFRDGQTPQISAAPPTARADVVLTPGQQAIVAEARIEIAAVDTQRVLAWRFGQMSLDAQPLADAVAEINRYNTRQIVLEDRSLAQMPISGLFQTGSPDAFVDAVSRLLPIEVASQDERSIRLRDARAH